MFDKEKVNNRTRRSLSWAKHILKKAEAVEIDAKKEQRLRAQRCKTCFYIDDGIGGQAITRSKCDICEKEVINASTDVDYICEECAKEYNLCRHCGGSIDMQLL
jgi:hypothetical protein